MPDYLDRFLDSIDPEVIRRKVTDAATRHGVDPALALGLAESESGFDQSATSKTGARGVFQFTQGTAGEMGIDREDLDQNIDGGVRYFGQLLSETNDPAEALRRYKGVAAGGASEADVSRALELADSQLNRKSGAGNAYSDRKHGMEAGDPLDDFLDEITPVPTRAEMESQAAELVPRLETLEGTGADLAGRKSALDQERSQIRHSDQLPEFQPKIDEFNAELAAYREEFEAYTKDAARYQAGARVYQQNAERLGGYAALQHILRPGAAPPTRLAMEPVSRDLLDTTPEQALFRPEELDWPKAELVGASKAKILERWAGEFARSVPSLATGVGDFILSQSEDSPALRTIGLAVASTGETVADALYQPAKDEDLEQWSGEWWASVTGGAAGSMVGFAGAARGTGVVADKLLRLANITGRAAQVAKGAGMLATGSALETVSQAGSDAAEVAREGKTAEEAAQIARRSALLSAGPTVLFNALGMYDLRAANSVRRILWDTGMEVAQENSQQVASNYATGRPLTEGLLESTVGAAFATGFGRQILRGAKGQPPAEPEAAPATTPPTGAPPSAAPPAPDVPVGLQVRALEIARKAPAPISKRDLVNGLAIGPVKAGEVLDALTRDGKLETTKEGNRTLYSVPGGAAPAAAATPAAAPVPTAPKASARAAPPTQAASEENRQQALQIAQREGRITPSAISNSLNLPFKQARQVFSELFESGQVTSRGKYLGKTPAEQPPEATKPDMIEGAAVQPITQEQGPAPQPAQIPPAQPPVVQTSAKPARGRAGVAPATPPQKALTQPKREKAPAAATPAAPSLFKQEARPAPTEPPTPQLPANLAAAKPRYAFGTKQFDLRFESDIDRAAYIAAQPKPSKRDSEYVAFVSNSLAIPESEVRQLGASVRARIKAIAAIAEPGTLTVPGVTTGQEAPPPLAVPAKPQPQPAADLYPRAVALAKDRGRVSTSAIAEEFGVSREEARALYGRLVRERVVNPVGKLVRAEAPAPKAEAKPKTPPFVTKPPAIRKAEAPPVKPKPAAKKPTPEKPAREEPQLALFAEPAAEPEPKIPPFVTKPPAIRKAEPEAKAAPPAAETPKIAPPPGITLSDEHIDFIGSADRGEHKLEVVAKNESGQPLGVIEYAETTEEEGIAHIENIKVTSSHRRQGLGMKMLGKLVDKYGYENIRWGLLTGDGARLKESADAKWGAPAAEAVKQPWEMTREEFRINTLRAEAERIEAVGNEQIAKNYRRAADALGDEATTTDVEKGFLENFWKYDAEHSDAIEAALREGKPVPAEVLADYPDLGKSAPPPLAEEIAPTEVETGRGERGGVTVDFLTFGAQLIRDGVVKFAAWSERMLAEFGQRIKPQLTRLYFEAKKFAADESGEFRPGEIKDYFKTPIDSLLKTKNPAKAVGDALKDGVIHSALKVVSPLESRIERAGKGAGRPIMEAIRTARDWGKVSAGKRLVQLAPAELSHLSREQRFNLLDVLEGRNDPMDDQVDKAFRVIRPILDRILEEAQYLDVVVARSRGGVGRRTPIEAMEDYFPHAIRDTKTLKSGPVRRDILENLVRQGIRDNRAEAESFLDEYIEFVKGGGRLDQLLAHLQATGQATSPADALAKLNRYRMNIKRHGSLEHAREINLPFYDPNPARVLPAHIVATSVRLAQIAELGQDNQAIAGHIHAIAQKGDNYQWVETQVNAILGWVNDTDDAEMTISRFLRATQIAKLGLAAIPNASQTFNTLLATDLPAVAAGLKGLLSKPGRVYAIESGALLDQFADASVRDIARTSRLVQAYLMAVGFTPVERANRIIAANAGAHYAGRLLNKLRQNPRHKRARRILAELGIDVDAALTRGQITGDELLLAANRISKRTQFTAAMEDYPAWAATPWGKLAFQFKTFIYSQTRFVGRELKGNIEDRDLPRLLRTLFLLTVLTQPLGEGIAFLRSLVTGRERDEEGLMRWLDNIAQVGGVGILWDMLQAAKYAPLSFIAGPAAQMVADIWKTVGTDPLNPEKWKKVGYRHGPEGRVVQRVIEGPAD